MVRPSRLEEEEVLETLPASGAEAPAAVRSPWGLFELLLKAPGRLDPFVRVPELQPSLMTGFVVITVAGMVLHALGLFAALYFAPREAVPVVLDPTWDAGLGGLAGLLAAYPAGILLATLVVLPSYWFTGRLAGVKMPLGEVLTHSLKGKAATAVLVVGLLPLYAVLMVCLLLAGAPAGLVTLALWLGLLLPYAAGLRGAGAIEAGFRNVVATTPDLRRDQRVTIPSSLMVLWALLFTLVVPVVMVKAYEIVSRLIVAH
ncbi:MAG: hypothetical protein U0736_25780 [Gemmataceae bacterium]